jgi:hypothetical protein
VKLNPNFLEYNPELKERTAQVKKILALLMIASMLFVSIGCGGTTPEKKPTTTGTPAPAADKDKDKDKDK